MINAKIALKGSSMLYNAESLAMCTYHLDENRMNAIQYSFANSIIERVRFCARLKTFSDVDSKSAQADM